MYGEIQCEKRACGSYGFAILRDSIYRLLQSMASDLPKIKMKVNNDIEGGANNYEINKWPNNKNIRKQLSMTRTIRLIRHTHTAGAIGSKHEKERKVDKKKGNGSIVHMSLRMNEKPNAN